MKSSAVTSWILVGLLAAGVTALSAQSQNSNSGEQQPQAKAPQQPAPQTQGNGNPFPEDEKSVPVMPSGNAPDVTDSAAEASGPDAAPPKDSDPVHSPEELAPGGSGATEGFSSSRSGLDNVVPDTDTDTTSNGKGKKGTTDVVPHETAKEDINVGNFYLDSKDWRGALSRFESAMVLAPDNPDVYWGLAECYRHLGRLSDARANYEMVVAYDPDSKHGKDAKKALKDPDLANAAQAPAHK